ncbi:hypothetical protein H2248_001992 [Termitomyces sp. 'cryptogamus']|nr:hypothetical protein H2248_001992 [Termitomyces sp. 'cryptogamus']
MSSLSGYISAHTSESSDSPTSQSQTAAGSPRVGTSEPPTPPEEIEDQKTTWWKPHYLAMSGTLNANAGLLLIIGSQAFFSMMNVAVKILNSIDPPVPTLELIAIRMFITYVFSLIYMLITKVPDPWLGPKGIRLLLVFRGFSGFFGLLGIYYSLQYLSLSDATVLTFLSPLCTGIAGAIFLKERYTMGQALASLCSLVGVVLIARPTFLLKEISPSNFIINEYDLSFLQGDLEKVTPQQRLIAVCVATLGVLGATGAYTSIAAMGKRAHPLHAMLSFSSQSVIAAVIGIVIQRTPVVIPTRVDWIAMLIMIGVFGFIAQTLLTMGLQRETAGRGSIAIYTQIVFAGILERTFFETEYSFLSVTGTFIIITSALCVGLTKQHAQKAKTKTNIRLSGSESDLEQGLLEGLLEAQTDEQSKVRRETEPTRTPPSKVGGH